MYLCVRGIKFSSFYVFHYCILEVFFLLFRHLALNQNKIVHVCRISVYFNG